MRTPRKKKRVLVVIGSASDRAVCAQGIALLRAAHERGEIEYLGCVVASIHRNTLAVLALACLCIGKNLPRPLRGLTMLLRIALQLVSPDDSVALDEIEEAIGPEGVDVIITAAGKANHLSGTLEAFVRHTLRNLTLTVLGVALPGRTEQANDAAWLSMAEVPGTKLVMADEEKEFRGPDGFTAACQAAVSGSFDNLTELPAAKAVEFER